MRTGAASEPTSRSARRVGLLLGLWFVMVGLLLLVGLTVLDGGATAPATPAAGAMAQRPTPARAGQAAASTGEQRLELRQLPAADTTPPLDPSFTVAACCRLRTEVADDRGRWREARFLGTCTVCDLDDRPLATLVGTTDPRPLAFRLPATVQCVRFMAAGHRTVERDTPAMTEGVLDFADVAMVPDAGLRIVLVGAGAGASGRANARVEGADFWRSESLPMGQLESGVRLPVPSGRPLSLSLQNGDAAALTFVARVPLQPLAAGEVRECAIDLTQLRASRIRVVGPSSRLLEGLVVAWSDAELHGAVALDGEGTAVLRGPDPTPLHFAVDPQFEGGDLVRVGGDTPAAGAATIALEPAAPLVGLQVRGEDAGFLPFVFGRSESRLQARRLRVLPREKLLGLSEVHVGVAGLGPLRRPRHAIVWDGDVGTLDVATATRGTALVVQPVGDLPPEAHRFCLLLQAADGATTTMRRAGKTFLLSDPPPGRYRLRWQIADQAAAVIDDALVIGDGERVERQVPWPAFALWQGTVVNWRALPPGDRFRCVRFGTWQRFHEGAQPPIDDAGRFLLPLPADSDGPGEVVEFRSGMQSLPGRVLGIDVAEHRVLVEHPPVRFVELKVAPRFSAKWMLSIDSGEALYWAMLTPSVPSRVLVPEGMVLHGVLTESVEGRPGACTTAFVVLDGSQREVTVAAGSGHWCAVKLAREYTTLSACLLDPRGHPAGDSYRLGGPGEGRLWVPDTASGIRLELDPGGVQQLPASRVEIEVR